MVQDKRQARADDSMLQCRTTWHFVIGCGNTPTQTAPQFFYDYDDDDVFN
jgi:hypothetical protein